MKKRIFYGLFYLWLIFASGITSADEHASQPHMVPAEAYGCTFNDGKTMADLDKVIKKWNDWMDASGDKSYGAWTMAPHHFDEWPFDVAWIGSWTDGVAMGKGKDNYSNKGGAIAAEFAKVVTCGMHSAFSELNVRAGDQNAIYK